MKKSFIVLLLLSTFVGKSQDFFEKFKKSLKEKEPFEKTEAIIKEWEAKDSNDPNLYVAAFNLYFSESRKEVLALDTKPGKGEQLELKDEKNNTVGYLHSTNLRVDSFFDTSIKYIDQGIAKFPKRLDLRFGKIFALGDFKKLDEFTNQIINTLDYSVSINHKWVWKENKPLEDEIIFIKSAIQDYQNTLFNNEDIKNLRKVGLKMDSIFPNDEVILSTLGTSYLLEENYSEALTIFLKANKINPKDTIILNNIAFSYSKSNDTINAKKYYQLMYDNGDEKQKKIAKEKLDKLK